ncbi:biotin--[acetyl-CoA-carboxylase] ligase [Prevotella sp. HCN-7019]|uniref:biotin--[acetyl-CoA-carboxylase] ligase n=1 Tax=Prevotella sp. HCN-7019 TaxID=3134668 RepID=UPI0030C30A35
MTTYTIRLDEVDSTNTYLRNLEPLPDADVVAVTAGHQTAGRGMGSNRWESEDGQNLLFSVLIRPEGVPVAHQFVLSMAEALAVKDALDPLADGMSLKWPNDVYWHDRKISGTLIETSLSGKFVKDCIFGTGVNINQREFRSDAPNPVSLWQITGRDTDINAVLEKALEAFEGYYAMVLAGEYDHVAQLYHEALYRRTGMHAYSDSNGRFMASIVRVGHDGRLVLRDEAGRERSYAFKEVNYII